MDILFVAPYVPNLIRVRPFNLIRQLSARGHRVTVLAPWTSREEQAEAVELQRWCHRVEVVHLSRSRSAWNCMSAVLGPEPLQSIYSWQPALYDRLAVLAAGTDVVHVEHLRAARYGVQLKQLLPRCPVVWDSVDCISLLFRQAARRSTRLGNRWMTRFELKRTEHYESWLLHQFEHVLVTSPADRDALLALRNGHRGRQQAPVTVIANGVDLDYFKPNPGVQRAPSTLVISGKMSYHANIAMVLHFVREILPRIWASRPDVRLCIAGKDPPHEIRTLAQNPAITVTGTVSDVRPYLQGATLAVAPIKYGAGIQNKVLEAMACATPTVASPQAVSALQQPLTGAVVVASTAEAFAEAVVQLLADPDRQGQIGEGGRHYVETHHNWQSIAVQLEGVYHAIVRADH